MSFDFRSSKYLQRYNYVSIQCEDRTMPLPADNLEQRKTNYKFIANNTNQ